MAESGSRGRSGKGGGSSSKRSSSSKASRNGRSPHELAREAVEQLEELIGRPVESVLGLERDDDGWGISLEVLELSRIPNTTDILGRYEVRLDGDGQLVEAQRTRRYSRSSLEDENGGG